MGSKNYIFKKKSRIKWKKGESYYIKNYHEDNRKKLKNHLKYFKAIKEKDEVLIIDEKNKFFQIGKLTQAFIAEKGENCGEIEVKIYLNLKTLSTDFEEIKQKYNNELSGFTFKKLPSKLEFIIKNEIIVKDVFDYLNKIKKVNEKLVFRGQSNKNWSILPSIYRTNYIENKEMDIYKSIQKHNFDEFKEQKIFLNEVIHMQHYGIPTGLLDWTRNPLVGLFFSSLGNLENDGKVFLFKPDKIYEFNEEEYENISGILEFIYGKRKKNSNKKINNKKLLANKIYKTYKIKKSSYFLDPIWENGRIKAQAGLFSLLLIYREEVFDKVKKELLGKIFEESIRNSRYFKKDNKKNFLKGIIKTETEIINLHNSFIEKYNTKEDYTKVEEFKKILEKLDNYMHKLDLDSNRGVEKSSISKEETDILLKILLKLESEINQIEKEVIIEKGFLSKDIECKCNLDMRTIFNFVIPSKSKKKIINQLDRTFNINATTMYPDVEGYVEYIKNKYRE